MIILKIFNLVIPELLVGVAPMVAIFLTIIISLRIAWVINNRQRFVLYKELLSLLFIMYLFILFYTVTFQDSNYGTSNFTPFNEITRYDLGTYKFYKNIIGNVLVFLPYAFFVTYYLKTKSALLVVVMTVIASLSVELTQLYLVNRVFDIDDVLLNILGGFLGFYFFRFLDRLENKLPAFMRKEVIINSFILVLVTVIFVYLLNLVEITWSLPWTK